MSTLQAHKTGGYRVDAEGAAGGQLVPMAFNWQPGGDVRLGIGEQPTALSKQQTPAVYGSRSAVRRLCPVECERLMSWPDGWTAVDGEDTPDSRRYAACGDGVVSNVAEWLARGILREDAA